MFSLFYFYVFLWFCLHTICDYEEELEELKRKCENTTRLITELEEKLFSSEKEKIELRSNREILLGKLNDLTTELEAYKQKYLTNYIIGNPV